MLSVFSCINIFLQLSNGKDSTAQTPMSSNSQQAANRKATNVMWMVIAIVFIVLAILLAITSIALGAMVYLSRKSVRSVLATKLTTHQGTSNSVK